MAARLVLVDRAGRPRLIAEAFLRQGGTVELSLRILDRQGNPRLVGGLFVHRDGTGEVAVAVLDRHGTARAVSAFFLREGGALEIFIGFHRIRHHLYFTARRAAFPAIPDDQQQQQRDLAYGVAEQLRHIRFRHDGVFEFEFGRQGRPHPRLRVAALLALARPSGVLGGGGWRLVIAAGSGPQARHGRFLPAAPLNPDGRLVPRLRVAALGVDPAPQWPVLADAAIGFDWPHLPLPAVADAALSVDGPLQLPLLAAAAIGLDGPRLPLLPAAAFGGLFVHRDGTGEVAVAVLDRHGTARAVSAFFLREGGALEIFIGFHRIRHHLYFTARRAAFPALTDDQQQQQRDLAYGVAEQLRHIRFRHGGVFEFEFGRQGRPHPRLRVAALLALARPSGVLGGGGWRLVIAAGSGLQARHGRFLPAAPLNPDGRLVPRLRVAALGVDPAPQGPVLADAAIGFDWPHLPLPAVPDAALSVDGPLQLPLLVAAAIGLDGPRLPLLPAAAFGIDGPRPLPHLAADAIGLEEPRLPVLPAAALDLTVVDDEELRTLEEGLGLEGDRCWIQQPATHDGLPSVTSSLLPRIFDLLEEVESVGYNIDDSTITEASMTLMVQMLDHMSERARMQILSNPALSVINQLPQDPTLSPPPQNRYPGTPPPQNRTTPPQSRYPGMWKSFITTVGLSVASNVLLYLFSIGIRLLEQTEQGSNIQNCAERQSKETQSESWNKWVMKFIAWLTERVAAPVVLTWLVILVRESVIDNEKYMLKYEKNGTVNVLINGISRAFFLGIRGFPGIHEADLWARLAAAAIDILGAAFLWWMGGHWDPDIADG